MPQPGPGGAPVDEDEGAMERRFADLMRRFWRVPRPTKQDLDGETE